MSTRRPERVDLPVSGMTCAACARTIERTLAKTPGVERANVNLATNTATVEYDPEPREGPRFRRRHRGPGLRRAAEAKRRRTPRKRATARA